MLLAQVLSGAPDAGARPFVVLEDPSLLVALEARSLDFSHLAMGTPDYRTALVWTGIVEVLAADLKELYARDPHYGIGMRATHRGLDPGWLKRPEIGLELVAVVPRLDRRPFVDGQSCGELRFVYRLAYRVLKGTHLRASRLPMTASVVLRLPEDGAGCAQVAARFLVEPTTLEVLTRAHGPLAADLTDRKNLRAVEVNLQSVRWPSTVAPTTGGRAEYLMRVFVPREDGTFEPASLENTPDVARLKADAGARADLLKMLATAENLKAIDEGTFVLPQRFLAKRALTVAPGGLALVENRPFSALFTPRDLAKAPLEGRASIQTPAALLRRLDATSCMGCHQARSVAGFHMLGGARPEEPAALALMHSAHMEEDLPRRRTLTLALANGGRVSWRREPAEHAFARGAFGDACGLGDAGFAMWTCAPGLRCARDEEPLVGSCANPTPEIGGRCDERARDACGGDRVCEAVPVGFPGGMCSGACAEADADNPPEAACGKIALLTPFNECLASGEDFADCATNARPALLRQCDASRPCRDDYACAQNGPRGKTAAGVCIPPYFVAELRVDGHPITPTPWWQRVLRSVSRRR